MVVVFVLLAFGHVVVAKVSLGFDIGVVVLAHCFRASRLKMLLWPRCRGC